MELIKDSLNFSKAFTRLKIIAGIKSMKATFIIIIFGTALISCTSMASKPDSESLNRSTAIADSVNFNTEVMPLLKTKCSPCHFEGGKMYEKMPFDNGLTIISHQAGILKRLTTEPVGTLIKQFIEERNKAN